MDVIRVTDQTSSAHLAVLISAECHRAKRVIRKVGNEKLPTAWDLHHDRIGELLIDWEAAKFREDFAPTRACTANCGPDCRDCA